MPLELRLLGSPAVLVDGQAIPLATRKALALLAYLALEGATARSKLADLLWSDMGDESARNNLRKELFRLRETPLRDALISTQTQLELRGVEVDALRFWQAAVQGDETALGWYAGPLFEAVELSNASGFEDWLNHKRQELIEIHLSLLFAKASRLETAGDWRGALEARRGLLETDALQESNHREIMRLHWQLGERGMALAQFDALCHVLQTELGVTPLPETLNLLSQIQRGAPETIVAPPPLAAPNLAHPPLIGREPAWQWLAEHQSGLQLLLGEMGVGKTRLLEDALRPTLVLRGFESAKLTPLYPVAEALRGALPALEPLEAVWKLEVARLIPELLSPNEQGAASGSIGQDGRARFLEALSRALQLAGRDQPVLLLDDLHWFDPSSLELVAHLVRRLPAHWRIAATARNLELSENISAQTMLSALEREGVLARLELTPFSEAQTLSLLQSLSGSSAKLFARRLHDTTSGNPLFTLETLRGLFESGSLHVEPDGSWVTAFDSNTEDYTELPIPQNVRELAVSRVSHLGGAVQRLLEVAALSGEPFEAEDLMPATALSEWESLEALERATSGQVVRAEGGAYRFSHDLLRRSLQETISPERQRLIHRRLADALTRNAAAPARIARHLELGGRQHEAAPWHLRAAQAAQRLYAHEEARRHYQRALELETNPKAIFHTHAALAELELTLLQLDALEAHAKAMLNIAQSENDTALLTEAHLMHAKAKLYRGQYREALEETQATVQRASHDLLPEALAILGTALIGCGQLEEAEPYLQQVLTLAQPRSPLIGEAHALLKEIYRQRGDLPRALEQAQLARDAHKAVGKREDELTMQAQAGQILGLLGRHTEALDALKTSLEAARALGLERVLTVSLVLIAEVYLRGERWVDAEQSIQEGLRLTRGKMLARECQFTGMLARTQQRSGRLSEALRTAQIALDLSEQLGHPMQQAQIRALLAELHLTNHNLEAGESQLQSLQNLCATAQSSAYLGHFYLLSAKLHLERGQSQEAQSNLRHVLGAALLNQPGYRSLFDEINTRLERDLGTPLERLQA